MLFKEYLADLDELMIRCRDEKTKVFLAEAIACYKSGAFRAAIVTTWIAVVFDFVAKLRELELAGDGQARHYLEQFERIHQEKDAKKAVQQAQDFERTVLDLAKDTFELLSSLEYKDLQRLYEDRHRCAHPTIHSLEEPYQPNGELVRYHLRNAVSFLLQQPPVQGKAAEQRIWDDIHSDYFPGDVQKAIDRLTHGPLVRARTSVIRNVIIGLTKSLLGEQRSPIERERQYAALRAVLQIHHQQGEQVLRSELPKLVAHLSDKDWPQVINYLSVIPFAWEAIGGPERDKAFRFIRSCPLDVLSFVLPEAFHIPSLKEDARLRFPDLPIETFAKQLHQELSPEYLDEAIRRFTIAENFKEARGIPGMLLFPLIPTLAAEQIIRLIEAFRENSQLRGSFRATDLMIKLFAQSQQYREEMKDAWIRLYASFYWRFDNKLVNHSGQLPHLKPLLVKIEERYPDTVALATELLEEQIAPDLGEDQEDW